MAASVRSGVGLYYKRLQCVHHVQGCNISMYRLVPTCRRHIIISPHIRRQFSMAKRWRASNDDGGSNCTVPTLVSPCWLADRIQSERGIRLLDASWHKAVTKRNAREEFLKLHIPSAQFFDIDECRDKMSPYDRMLPQATQFEEYVGEFGISNDTHVVVYDNSVDHGMFSAQRAWWMFRVFDHRMVSILDGGLPQWIRENRPTTNIVEHVPIETFHARYNPHMVKSFEDIQQNLVEKQYLIVDTRSPINFYGNQPDSKPESSTGGHIPGAVNVHYALLMDPHSKLTKTPAELKEVFDSAGVDLNKPIISSCGSGVSACSVVLAAHLLGYEDIPVYDGSWSEWSRRAQPDQKVIIPKH